MKIFRKLFLIFAFIVIVVLSLFSLSGYIDYKIVNLKNEQYKQESIKLKKQLINLIEAKKKGSMAIAMSLAEDSSLKEALQNSNSSVNLSKKFKEVSQRLRIHTDYENVWIQIINAKGVSLSRSWVDKKPDALLNVRADIQEMIKSPRVMSTISTGKFSMAFKSMFPIFDDNKHFIGIIETVTHFNSIVRELERINISSLILADKRYQSQLTKSVTKRFINGYYVVNFKYDEKNIQLLQAKGIETFLHIPDFVLYKNYFITTYILKDIHGKDMGYFIMLKDLENFEYKSIDDFVYSIFIIVFAGLLLAVVTIIFFYKRRNDIEKQKTYFKEIIDSTSDIIVISNTKHPLDVNKAFFELFDNFSTLKEFEKVHGCICDMFEQGEGFVQKQMGKYTWVEYILQHKDKEHKVKITHKGQIYYFSVHIKQLNDSIDKVYTVVLTDITQMKMYQEKLEHLTQTDTLTSIGNREYFNLCMPKEINRARRYQHQLSLVMIDIDYFKTINDTYGHDIGDLALIKLTQTIQNLLRKTDIFCRYGGEEFMIIMPESSIMETAISAERIRKHIEQLKIEPIETMTISIGLTELHNEDTLESFIKRVDNALYKSKENGRNRITSE